MLLEHLVNDNGIPDLSSDQVRFIQDLIMGEPSKGYDGQHFLFDIVANKRNSIDVDKVTCSFILISSLIICHGIATMWE